MNDPTPRTMIYTHATCADSDKVRAWLSERGIAFTELDVTRDLNAAKALLATGIFATPLLVVGDEQVLGFRPAEITRALVASSIPVP